MGSGDKFQFTVVRAFGFAIYYDQFPHQHSIGILLGCFSIYLGFGKGYDEQ
jgi:hypothetical protein